MNDLRQIHVPSLPVPPGTPMEIVPCEVCRGDSIDTVPATVVGMGELCSAHEAELCKHVAETVLRRSLPIDVHGAQTHDLVEQIREWTPVGGEGVYIYGEPGRGKTWQAAALAKRGYIKLWKSTGRIPTVVWFPVTVGIDKIKRGFNGEAFNMESLHTADLLILDDIGMEQATAWSRSLIYTIVNERMVYRRPTIYTSNLTVAQLATRLEAIPIASRIAGHTIQVRIDGPDRRIA